VCLSSSRSFVDCVEVMGNMIRQLGYFVGIEGKLGTNVASTLNVKLALHYQTYSMLAHTLEHNRESRYMHLSQE
jgi:hypothetical protein